MSAPILLHDLTLGYDGHPAVHHVSGVIEAGALLAVVGPNGAGKSTLIKGIAGIYSFDSGSYLFEGKPVEVTNPKHANALGIEVV
ncbi:MAG TPA: ATP-binding cassette domain-containing protein, partial [Ottowia sp.]|nr:ATP-binding cassette domain-containing protein [Ottowia sp.]